MKLILKRFADTIVQDIEFTLKTGENVLGRYDKDTQSKPEISLEMYDQNLKISRRHAVVIIDTKNKVYLQDLGSRNGTFIKGKEQQLDTEEKIELKDGDEFIVGEVLMKFSLQS
jgi:predicted component of type VI protein secretion system